MRTRSGGNRMSEDRIQILGSEEGPEYSAACHLKTILLPQLRDGDRVKILVNYKCAGEQRQDLDLIVLGTFKRGLSVSPPNVGGEESARLVNLAAIIEVKDHPPESVRVDASHVKVRYGSGHKRGWHDATEQLQEQVHSLIGHLKRGGVEPPFIAQMLWLRNVSTKDRLSNLPNNVLCGQPTFEAFSDLLCRVRLPIPGSDGRLFIAFSRNRVIDSVVEAMRHLGESFKPTPLDRRRLEKVGQRLVSDQKYVRERGKQLLSFRGRGGSGKTIHLIRLAKGFCDEFGDRILLLTYNHALAADIRRLISLMGLRDSVGNSGFVIQTAEKFFVGLVRELDEWEPARAGLDYESYYKEQKGRVLSEIESLERGEARDLLEGDYDKFGWDLILIDEAQDWPEDERDLLYAIYGPERCVVADGVDQLVRGTKPCDWANHRLVQGQKQVVPLRQSLRLTSNLCRFVSDFANEAGLEWDQDPNDQLLGGRVIVVEGSYTRELHDEIMGTHAEKGNFPIDSLFCAPPKSGEPNSDVAAQLESWGLKVWDGTRPEVRGTFPTDREQYRVVKYESCRGLEGWTVVCLGIDRFFENKLRFAPSGGLGNLFASEGESKRRIALSWCLIPLTRAIDVLVLQVSPGTEMREMLHSVFERNRDFVEWQGIVNR